MRFRPRFRPFDKVRWWLPWLGLLACQPQMLLGELVDAAAGTAGTAGTDASGGDPSGGGASGGDANGSASGDGGDAGDAAAGAPSSCSFSDGGGSDGGSVNTGPLPAPWETSFEDGFCGYRFEAGFCYSDQGGSYRVVTSPVRTGAFAAAFGISLDNGGESQARCVRQGQLPNEAYYGAWYYLPQPASDLNNWNLFYFQGGEPGMPWHGLWDVSLAELPSGELAAYVRDGLRSRVYEQSAPVAVPIGRWFQLEFYLKRATDATGEIALFQDGVEVIRMSRIRTDDSSLAQWYVGNLALGLTPSSYILYVDDVTVRLGP